MKTRIGLMIIWCWIALPLAAGAAINESSVKFSVVPGLEIPRTGGVRGLDLGLLATATAESRGFQIAPFFARLDQPSEGGQAAMISISGPFRGIKTGLFSLGSDVQGAHYGWITICRGMNGIQNGIYSQNSRLEGLQAGLVNVSQAVTGMQVGLVNYTDQMYGIQLGLINIITRSQLPVMVLLNWSY